MNPYYDLTVLQVQLIVRLDIIEKGVVDTVNDVIDELTAFVVSDDSLDIL